MTDLPDAISRKLRRAAATLRWRARRADYADEPERADALKGFADRLDAALDLEDRFRRHEGARR